MSPYEVKLLVHIDSCFDPIPFKKTDLLQDTILDFIKKGLIIESKSGMSLNWETTKLGRIVCRKFYGVDESHIEFCGECGQVLP